MQDLRFKTLLYRASSCPSAHGENLFAARARALTASSSRFLGKAFVSSEVRRVLDADATWSTAARNAASLAFDGLLKPLTFLTNCSAAERISSSVAGGSKLNRVLMFLHMSDTSIVQSRPITKRLRDVVPERFRRAMQAGKNTGGGRSAPLRLSPWRREMVNARERSCGRVLLRPVINDSSGSSGCLRSIHSTRPSVGPS